jgi:hypothetical protein
LPLGSLMVKIEDASTLPFVREFLGQVQPNDEASLSPCRIILQTQLEEVNGDLD